MKKGMMWLCVSLAVCFVAGTLFAAEGDKPRPKRTEAPRVTGVVKAIAEDGTSITVTVKKEDAEKDMTFAIVKEGEGATKVFAGREAKTLADVKVGLEVTVVYQATDAGDTAKMIRLAGEKKRAPMKE